MLKGKVALVTGGASGIGAAIVREFVDQGAKVLLTDINNVAGVELAKELGEDVAFFRHDVSLESDWIAAVAEAEKRFGAVTILINNAGIVAVGNNEGPIESISLADYRKVVDVNQVGTFLGIKHVVPSMRRAGGGAIVNMASTAGLVGVPYLSTYSTTKWAVTGLTKCAALELGQYGIRVNSIHPGVIATPIHIAGQSQEQAHNTRTALESLVQSLPLPRIADAVEVAKMAAFVVSDAASYSTGSQFVVDGGMVSM